MMTPIQVVLLRAQEMTRYVRTGRLIAATPVKMLDKRTLRRSQDNGLSYSKQPEQSALVLGRPQSSGIKNPRDLEAAVSH
jgi:hypothetical protein